MTKNVQLSKEDCYCDLTDFYENVARKIPVGITDRTLFDCRKICVTKLVQDTLWSYYREEQHISNMDITAIFLIYGPKANLKKAKDMPYRAEVEDGFISYDEE